MLPTVNVPARDASLALAVKVFREGLLDRADSGDIGWAAVDTKVLGVAPAGGRVAVTTPVGSTSFDAVIVATPPGAAASLSVFPHDVAERLGASPIVNVNLVFDRRVTDLELFAAIDSPIQFVFDRTTSSGLDRGQSLGISISAADHELTVGSDELVATHLEALRRLLPDAHRAEVVDAFVTRERAATFRGGPGTAALRPAARSGTHGVFLAGAWCATGWPATMEGAVRSGSDAAQSALRWLADPSTPSRSSDLVTTQ